MSGLRAQLLFAVIIFLCPGNLSAQATSGGIFGTVVDSTGAVVVDAKVTIIDVSKGVTVGTTTNESGNYIKTHLTVGMYKVTVEGKGFRTYVQENVPVSVDANTRVDAKLEVGDVSQEITVSETPPLIQSDRAEVSDTLQSREVGELPVANRNFTQLELMMPGTTKMTWQHASSENPQGGIQINTNGQLFGMNNFMIDGADNNDPVLGIIFQARDPFTQGLHDPGTPEPKNRGVAVRA